MKRAAWLLLLPMLALVLNQPAQPALAGGGGPDDPGPDKNPVSMQRPFIEKSPDWDAGVALCRKVVEGDKDATAEFRASGLTYTPHFSAVKLSNDELQDAYVRHWDWIQDMQKWEYAFVNGDPADIMKLYQKLEPRFRSAETQLARAILYAHDYGDYPTRDALIALKPKSLWVKAASGFLALDMTPREACEQILLVLDEVNDLHQMSFMIFLGMVVPKDERPQYWGNDMKRAQIKDLTGPDGVNTFYAFPHQWRYSLYYERLGALLSEVDDKEYVASVEKLVTKSVEGKELGEGVLDAFHYPIWFSNRTVGNWTAQSLESRATVSMGPNLTIESIFNTAEYMWFTRATSAAIAFAGMPDNTLCRRNMLARCLSVKDPMLTRLACRSVMAVYDDQLVGYSDIGRALMVFGQMPELTEAWAKALKATKNADLLELAAVIEKGDPAPLDKPQRKALTLTLEQKASLLATFCNAAEIRIHGGETALYWLNLAVFREALRSLRTADTAYWNAIEAAEGKEATATVNPVILEYLNFCERNYTENARDRSFLRASATQPKLVAKVKRIRDELNDEDSPLEKNALARARHQVNTQRPMSDELLEELVSHPEKWGGEGYALAGEQGMLVDVYPLRRRNVELAVESAPLNQPLHFRQGPENENAGTMLAANWDHAARHVLALHLLQPLDFDTLCAAADIHIRNGESQAALVSQALASNSRASTAEQGMSYVQASMFLQFGRKEIRTALHRRLMADPDRLNAKAETAYQQLLWGQWWGTNSDQVVGGLATVIGPEALFARKTLEAYTATWDMNDVNNLLNFSTRSFLFEPELAISYVEKADELGVSRYGEFVGTQGWVGAHAKLGKLKDALERYHDLRADRVGMPAYLDFYLVAGLTSGNNHAEAEAAIEAIETYDHTRHGAFFDFLWRRTFMLAGRHDEIGALPLPQNSHVAMEDAREYTLLFHEARPLLDAGEFSELEERTKPYLTFHAHDDIGVYLDAAVMKIVALKAAGKELPRDEESDVLRVLEPDFVDLFLASPNLMDWTAMEMLCGRTEFKQLPAVEIDQMWHATVYGERPPGYFGANRINFNEAGARDRFIRGIWAWAQDDAKTAREMLATVVEFNVRSSYEYHVAEWLLANSLKDPKETPPEEDK